MSKNIFVGSLAWATTSEGLEQAFAQFGVVTSAKVISDRETGRSKGFGFVEMESGGDEAIEALNGADMDGRQIVVNEARPREDRGG
ncbi:MAG: RNA-binding protein, partial [Fuerstiella sp.]